MSFAWQQFLIAIRHKPRIHYLLFNALQLTHNLTPDLCCVALG
jgi:hypothetical protein